MKAIYLCGGTRFECFSELIASEVVQVNAVICGISRYNREEITSKFKALCNAHGIPFILIEHSKLKELSASLSYDTLISVGYRFIIDKEVIQRATYAINLHPTLLPKYRGYRSGPYIIMNNEKETGVTVHFIDEGMDTGDIILQKKVPLTAFDTVKSMLRKTGSIEGSVLIESLKMLKENSVTPISQDESQATVYNEVRKPKDSEIDPNKSLTELYHIIRACDPVDYPAFFFKDGEKVCIKLWRPDKTEDDEI
jgi:methionyl-tRNA formyltransferase